MTIFGNDKYHDKESNLAKGHSPVYALASCGLGQHKSVPNSSHLCALRLVSSHLRKLVLRQRGCHKRMNAGTFFGPSHPLYLLDHLTIREGRGSGLILTLILPSHTHCYPQRNIAGQWEEVIHKIHRKSGFLFHMIYLVAKLSMYDHEK